MIYNDRSDVHLGSNREIINSWYYIHFLGKELMIFVLLCMQYPIPTLSSTVGSQ